MSITRRQHSASLIALWPYALLLLVGIVAPLFVSRIFLMHLWSMALFASAFNLLVGTSGLLSFGHAAFYGGAAYLTGFAAIRWGLTTELAILAGVAGSAVLGLAFGWLAIRRHGIYFAMITLALAQLVYFSVVRSPFTNREDGLQGIPRGTLLGIVDLRSDEAMYFVVFGSLVIGLAIIHRITRSPTGLAMNAVRQNEARAVSLGYRADRLKLLIFVLSAALAGLAGSVKTIAFQVVAPSDVHWVMSGLVILMVLVGGLGTLVGPLLGVAVITSLEHYLSFMGSWFTLLLGALYIACVHLFRDGIAGEVKHRLASRHPPPAEAGE